MVFFVGFTSDAFGSSAALTRAWVIIVGFNSAAIGAAAPLSGARIALHRHRVGRPNLQHFVHARFSDAGRRPDPTAALHLSVPTLTLPLCPTCGRSCAFSSTVAT